MNAPCVSGLTSIIIPCWNQLEFTRKCIASLFRQTGPGWELIVVNNGSTDGTADYLGGIQDCSPVPVTIIANATNRGFPAAINQGLQHARGEYLVLLNNDVVVTDGWLAQLTGLASSGLTGEKDQRNGRGRWAVEVEGESEPKVLIRESKDRTENTNTLMDKVSEVTDAYPGRNITVIYLSPLRNDGEGGGRIGLVGPMSNYAAPPQLVENVPYHDLEQMKVFACRWRDEHRGKWFTTCKLSGFCLLMTREVYAAIGGLDERFGLGFFDDDDLAERARRAGFGLAVAHDLFVHHFGSRTFVGNGVDAERVLDENARRFSAKWGNSVPQGVRVGLKPFPGGPRGMTGQSFIGHDDALGKFRNPRSRPVDGPAANGDSNPAGRSNPTVQSSPPTLRIATAGPGLTNDADRPAAIRAQTSDRRSELRNAVPEEERAGVSLTMIVRDEESNISRCLESVRGVFDEIVVLDTGSKDRTIQIAREFGARVFDFVWVDDFAAARNAALARAKGDYAFWLDADDVIEPSERAKLEQLLKCLRRDGGHGAFVVRCACDSGPNGEGGETVVDHVRLFPVIEGVRWMYRVHEQILPGLKRAGVPVQWSDVTVRHTGYADRDLRSRKLDRDSKILLQELADRPDDPFTLLNLGSVAIERTKWTEALEYLNRSLAHSAPTDSIVRKLYALIARAHQMLIDPHSALRACAEGLSLDADDAELWFRKAIVHRHCGQAREAEECWRKILTLSRPQKFASVDQGIYGHLTRRNLAALAMERSDIEEARRLWNEVLAECPGDRETIEVWRN